MLGYDYERDQLRIREGNMITILNSRSFKILHLRFQTLLQLYKDTKLLEGFVGNGGKVVCTTSKRGRFIRKLIILWLFLEMMIGSQIVFWIYSTFVEVVIQLNTCYSGSNYQVMLWLSIIHSSLITALYSYLTGFTREINLSRLFNIIYE